MAAYWDDEAGLDLVFLPKLGKTLRRSLMIGVSVTALVVGVTAPRSAQAGLGDQAALAQRLALPAATPSNSLNAPVVSGSASGSMLGQQVQIAKSNADLARAATAITAAAAAQAQAQLAAANAPLTRANGSPVTDGLSAQGLMPYGGISPGNVVQNTDTSNATSKTGLVWQGANPQLQQITSSSGATTVTITQTAAQAILTWKGFDVGKNTTLVFNQPKSDSIALNRVVANSSNNDGSRVVADPTYILGKIRANGQIWIINPNGVIFSGSSQINVGSLLVSTLDVGDPWQNLQQRNAAFLSITNTTPARIDLSYQDLIQTVDGTPSGAVAVDSSGAPVLQTDSVTEGDLGHTIVWTPVADAVEGAVDVRNGAQISTTAVSGSNSYLGKVILAGPVVQNEGAINTPDGQVILAGGRFVQLIANVSYTNLSSGGSSPVGGATYTADPNLRGLTVHSGTDLAQTIYDPNGASGNIFLGDASAYLEQGLLNAVFGDHSVSVPSGYAAAGLDVQLEGSALNYPGSVTNSGSITAERGNISMVANAIFQGNVVEATTSVKENGSIYIDGQTVYVDLKSDIASTDSPNFDRIRENSQLGSSVEFAASSVMAILPDTTLNPDGTTPTLPDGSASGFASSFIKITSGSTVLDGGSSGDSGALIDAPGAKIQIGIDSAYSAYLQNASVNYLTGVDNLTGLPFNTDPTLTLGSNAAVDASGLMGVVRSADYNLITVPRVGLNELADDPLQRSGPLYKSSVTIDRRYAPTIFDASGYINNFALDISALMETGGHVSISGVSLLEQNSVISVAGGYNAYAAGTSNTTRLVGADGSSVVDISQANPNTAYSAIAGQYVVDHPRWNITTTYASGIGFGGTYTPAYVEGAQAGSVTLGGLATLDGVIDAGAVAGATQRTTSGTASTANAATLGGTIDLSNLQFESMCIGISGDCAAGSTSGVANTQNALSALANFTLNSEFFTASGASTIEVGSPTAPTSGVVDSLVTVGESAALDFLPGTKLTLAASRVEIDGSIRIASGAVTVDILSQPAKSTLESSFELGSGGSVDLSGQTTAGSALVNDSGAAFNDIVGRDFVDGGTFIISASTGTAIKGSVLPVSVALAAGSTVELDSSGYVGRTATLATDSNTGLPYGRGGSLSLLLQNAPRSSFSTFSVDSKGQQSLNDTLVLGGSVSAYGLDGGGTFAFQAPSIVISQSASNAISLTNGVVMLPSGFFGDQSLGFGSYNLTALFTAQIAPNTTIRMDQRQFLPDAVITTATTATDAFTIGREVGTLRPATNLSITALGLIDVTTALNDPKNTAFIFGDNPEADIEPGGFGSGIADRTLVFSSGSTIETDPYAKVSMTAYGELTFNGAIIAPGGTVSLSQFDATETDTAVAPNTIIYAHRALDLGAGSTIDTSAAAYSAIASNDPALLNLYAGQGGSDEGGSYIPNPNVVGYRAGKVIGGGSVSIAAYQMYGETGSVINVSGGSATLDLAGGTGLNGSLVPTQIATDAGAITFTTNDAVLVQAGVTNNNVSSLVELDTRLIGQGGNNSAANATVSVPNAILESSLTVASPDLKTASGIDQGAPAPGVASSGSNVNGFISASRTGNVSASISNAAYAEKISIGGVFRGAVNLNARREIDINVSTLDWRNDASNPGSNTVSLAAPIIRLGVENLTALNLNGALAAGPAPVAADETPTGNFFFEASQDIDVGQITVYDGRIANGNSSNGQSVPVQYSQIQSLTLISGRDLRLLGDAGYLRSGGNITLQGAEIYPDTHANFLIQSTAANGLVTFARSAADQVMPLSAGGTLTVAGANIIQGGVLYAPFGEINLGVRQPVDIGSSDNSAAENFQSTRTVDFLAGSITSVSALGDSLPYGQTSNLSAWYYTDANGQIQVTSTPAKSINVFATGIDFTTKQLAGNAVTFEQGATVDESGGGDAIATEFIAGTGGSRNVLTTAIGSSADAAIYAIVPSYQGSVAPIDLGGYSGAEISARANALDPSLYDIGRTITLSKPADGLAAGTYLLLPATYAVLPGAVRVQVASASSTIPAGSQQGSSPDGTDYQSVYLGYTNGTQNGMTTTVSLQTSSVWRQYSEIDSTSASKFFQAATGQTIDQNLPDDAGRLSLWVTSIHQNGASFNMAATNGARGGELDITGAGIEVISSDILSSQGPDLNPAVFTDKAGQIVSVAPPIILTPGEITSFDADSVLLGGKRSQSTNGETILIRTGRVEIKTDAADPLVAKELIIVAGVGVPTKSQDLTNNPLFVENNQLYSIDVKTGSEILTSGTISSSGAETLQLLATGQGKGDGAFLRVSNGGAVTLQRASEKANTNLYIGDGVIIGAASPISGLANGAVEISASGNVIVPVTTTINAQNVSVQGGNVYFTTAGSNNNGINLSTSLSDSSDLDVQARNLIEFDSAFSFVATGSNSSVTLDAPNLILGASANGQNASQPSPTISFTATTVTVTNSFSAEAAPADGIGSGGILNLTADNLVFSGNDRAIAGFSSVNVNAMTKVSVGDGAMTGTWALPGNVTITTPILTVSGDSTQTIDAMGNLAVVASGPVSSQSTDVGGQLTLDGQSVTVGTYIWDRVGTLALHSGTGGIHLESTAVLDDQGVSVNFRDAASIVLPGGLVSLTADGAGGITLDAGSQISVEGGAGGDAGTVKIATSSGSVITNGTVLGNSGGVGTKGGSFALVSGGDVDLSTSFYQTVFTTAGFTQDISIDSGQGDLTLARNVQAANLYLSADRGTVILSSTVDADGAEGGTVQLFGAAGVTLTSSAVIDARGTDTTQRGGQVMIGTGLDSAGNSGVIDLATGSTIDVGVSLGADANGNSLGYGSVSPNATNHGSSGSTVHIRAPLVDANDQATADATKIVGIDSKTQFSGVTIDNASQIILEPYQRIDLSRLDSGVISGTPGGKTDGWTQILTAFDPTTTDSNGDTVAGSIDRAANLLTSTYGKLGAQLSVMPGLELDNFNPAVNHGDITIVEAINLDPILVATTINAKTKASVTTYSPANVNDPNGQVVFDANDHVIAAAPNSTNPVGQVRYGDAGTPGILTIRAVGDVHVTAERSGGEASISDGFATATTTTNTYNAKGASNKSVTTAVDGTTTGANLVAGETVVTGTDSAGNPILTVLPTATWSLNFIAGAGVLTEGGESADPASLAAAATFLATGSNPLANRGNFILGDLPSGLKGAVNPLNAPITIRTGTGSIDIAASGHGLCDSASVTDCARTQDASPKDWDNAYYLTVAASKLGFTISGEASIMYLSPTATIYTAGYNAPAAADFIDPTTPAFQSSSTISGVVLKDYLSSVTKVDTAPTFTDDGGDIRLTAPNGSIVGQAHFYGVGEKYDEIQTSRYWLLGQGNPSASDGTNGAFNGIGVNSVLVSGPAPARGYAEWVSTATFQDGIAALGGGDVTLRSGADVRDLSASVISAFRVLGGTSGSDPAHVQSYGGGNLAITAIDSVESVTGFVQEGQITATAGRDIGASFSQSEPTLTTDATSGSSVSVYAASNFILSGASLNAFARGAVGDISVEEQTVNAPETFFQPGPSDGYLTGVQRLFEGLSYGPEAGNFVKVIAASGDVTLAPLTLPAATNIQSSIPYGLMPSDVTIVAANGSLNIQGSIIASPSATGSITLLAEDSIDLTTPYGQSAVVEQINLDPLQFVSLTSSAYTGGGLTRLSYTSLKASSVPYENVLINGGSGELYAAAGYELDDTNGNLAGLAFAYHPSSGPLQAGDTSADLMIAVTGDIINGTDPNNTILNSYFSDDATDDRTLGRKSIYLDKFADIYAGRDIVNMIFEGQNDQATQATLIRAGRDITYTIGPDYSYVPVIGSVPGLPRSHALGSNFVIGGTGQFTVIAGRNLNLAPSEYEANLSLSFIKLGSPNKSNVNFASGIQAIGNRIDPYLPNQQRTAAANVFYGVAPGIDSTGFINTYLDPATSLGAGYLGDLVTYFRDEGIDGLTADTALQRFQALSQEEQLPFLQQILFDELRDIADPASADYLNYLRADQAINGLFPAAFGYTQNYTTVNGADTLLKTPVVVKTGDFDISGATGGAVISTNYGAGINIVGPGGQAVVGGFSTPTVSAASYGILPFNGGDINMFTDGNIDVNSSKILALDGGNLTIFSNHGSIDAGRGKKTTNYVPPFTVNYSSYLGVYSDPLGAVAGAGIGTLITIPGASAGNAYLLAPNGDINAGDAGIRSSGNLFVVALQVIGADNISVGGKTTGIPEAPSISTTLLSAAGNSDVAANRAVGTDDDNRKKKRKTPSIIDVGFVNFGEPAPGDTF